MLQYLFLSIIEKFGLRSKVAFAFRLYTASGDIRTNGDKYVYKIQLSGITDSAHPQCSGANVCQIKTTSTYVRKVGSSAKAKYYVQGKSSLTRINSQKGSSVDTS